jgi:hypothetical protein
MRSIFSLTFFIWFIACAHDLGQTLHAVNIESQSDSVKSIRLKVQNDSFKDELETIKIKNKSFLKWRKSEHINHRDIGQPDIPTLHRLVVVDPTQNYKMKFKLDKIQVIADAMLYPVQADSPEGSPTPKFSFDAKAYRSRKNFGAPWVEFGTLQTMGRFSVLPIKIHLAQFNPRSREIIYFNNLDISIEASEATIAGDNQFLTMSQMTAVEQLTINGFSVTSELPMPRRHGSYLVVTTEDLLSIARDFAERHREKGMSVYYEIVTPTTKSSVIKSLIQNHYNSKDLEVVLLFGDETKVQLHRWGSTPGDSYYSLVDGNDGLADILIGRIPASSPAEAEAFLQKTSAYEDARLSQAFNTNKVMLVAHREDYPGKYTANLESIRTAPNPKNLEFSIQYGGRGAKNQSVIELTDQNFSIINYRGHGSPQSWSSWGSDGSSFGASQIDALKNIDEKISIFFNIACSNGAIQSNSKSMAERLIWPKGDTSNRGAIAVLAATEPSMTAVNHKYNRYLFSNLQTTTGAPLGLVNMLAANQLVRDNGGSVPSNNKMYILFGDPLLSFKHDE